MSGMGNESGQRFFAISSTQSRKHQNKHHPALGKQMKLLLHQTSSQCAEFLPPGLCECSALTWLMSPESNTKSQRYRLLLHYVVTCHHILAFLFFPAPVPTAAVDLHWSRESFGFIWYETQDQKTPEKTPQHSL